MSLKPSRSLERPAGPRRPRRLRTTVFGSSPRLTAARHRLRPSPLVERQRRRSRAAAMVETRRRRLNDMAHEAAIARFTQLVPGRVDLTAARSPHGLDIGTSSSADRPLLDGHKRTEQKLRLVDIVATTVKGQVGHGRLATERVWVHVVELQERALATAPTRFPHERAPTAVPQPDRSPDMGRDVPRPSGDCRARPRLRGRR